MSRLFLLGTLIFVVSCASSVKETKRNSSPWVQELSAHVLTQQAAISLASSLDKSPWQWRRDNVIGARAQSMVPPLFVDAKRVLISTLGGGLSLFDIQLGSTLWKKNYAIGAASVPLVVEESVYIATMDSRVQRLKLSDGSVEWEAPVSAESLGGMAYDRGILYVSIADDSLWALDVKTGRALWTYKRPSPDSVVYWSLRGQAVPVFGPKRQNLYIGFSDGYFICLNPINGETRWELDFRRVGRFQDADTTVQFSPNGRVIYLSLVDGNLSAINSQTGQLLWTQPSSSHSKAYVDPKSGDVFYSTSDFMIKRVSSDGLRSKWHLKLGKKGIASSLVEVGDRYLAATTTHFGIILIDKESGQIVWEKYLGEGIVAEPSFNGKQLLVLSGRNFLRIFNVRL